MKTQAEVDLIRGMVRSVAETCAMLVQRVADLSDQIDPTQSKRGGDGLTNILQDQPVDAQALFTQIIVDPASRTVTYRGRSCSLGNTLMFGLIERLARRPNSFVSFDRLVRDVWHGHAKSDDAVRSVMKELRARLRKCRMQRLASALASDKRSYGLILR